MSVDIDGRVEIKGGVWSEGVATHMAWSGCGWWRVRMEVVAEWLSGSGLESDEPI